MLVSKVCLIFSRGPEILSTKFVKSLESQKLSWPWIQISQSLFWRLSRSTFSISTLNEYPIQQSSTGSEIWNEYLTRAYLVTCAPVVSPPICLADVRACMSNSPLQSALSPVLSAPEKKGRCLQREWHAPAVWKMPTCSSPCHNRGWVCLCVKGSKEQGGAYEHAFL